MKRAERLTPIVLLVFLLLFFLSTNDSKQGEKNTDVSLTPLELQYIWNENTQTYGISKEHAKGDYLIDIPMKYNEIPVSYIENNAFQNISKTQVVDIPNSIVSIGELSFNGCIDLRSIIIPSSVQEIGIGAFSNCSSLAEITVEDSNQFYSDAGNCLIDMKGQCLILGCVNSVIPADGSVTSIADYAFWGAQITDMVIPASVVYIGKKAFSETPLQSIEISSSVIYIEDNAFDGKIQIRAPKDSYAAKWAIQRSYPVTYIEDYYHGEPKEAMSFGLSFSESVGTYVVIGSGTEEGETINIPDRYRGKTVVAIREMAFIMKENIKSVKIPSTVTTIGGAAFKGCSSLEQIEFGDSLTSIGVNAFYACLSLKKIELPKSLTNLAEYAFNGCQALEEVIIRGDIKEIHTGTFHSCSSLKKVVLPKTIEHIERDAFYWCPDDITFYVAKGSYCEEWAKSNGYAVEYKTGTE